MEFLINAYRILCQEAAIRLEHEGADERYSALASAIQDLEKYVKEINDSKTLDQLHGIRQAWLPKTMGRWD